MKKLLLFTLLSSLFVSYVGITNTMNKREREEEQETSNKKKKTEKTFNDLSNTDILPIFKFVDGQSANSLMSTEKRNNTIFDKIEKPETILSITLVDAVQAKNKKLTKLLLKNAQALDGKEANDALIWAAGSGDNALVKILLESTDFLAHINRRGANDSVGWASENGSADVVETLLTNKTIADLVSYGIKNGLEWAANKNRDYIYAYEISHVPVFLALLTFAPNSCARIIDQALTELTTIIPYYPYTNPNHGYTRLRESMLETCFRFALKMKLNTSFKKLLSHNRILTILSKNTVNSMILEATCALQHGNEVAMTLLSNDTIMGLANKESVIDLLDHIFLFSRSNLRLLLKTYALLNNFFDEVVLFLFMKGVSKKLYFLTPDVANYILVFAAKKGHYEAINSLFGLTMQDFMNCIDAQGAQEALDNALNDEIYELLEQNKQIRKLLKLDSWCVIQ